VGGLVGAVSPLFRTGAQGGIFLFKMLSKEFKITTTK